jgi:uncharacterized RmlC-like cupin family protein
VPSNINATRIAQNVVTAALNGKTKNTHEETKTTALVLETCKVAFRKHLGETQFNK